MYFVYSKWDIIFGWLWEQKKIKLEMVWLLVELGMQACKYNRGGFDMYCGVVDNLLNLFG